MSEAIVEIRLFGKLRLQINDKQLDLEECLGRQLSALFALFVCNHRQILSKEMLMETMWSDSDNPTNAMKFAIFRLRNTLKTIPEMAGREWIKTAKNGYQFNPDFSVVLDIEQFEDLILKGKRTNNLKDYQQSLNLYQDHLLSGMDSDWVILDRGYYRSMYFQAAELLSSEYLKKNWLKETLDVCKKALTFDPFNEEIIFNYLKALIEGKQYNAALVYYEDISRRFYKEMGLELQLKTRSLFNIISSGDTHASKADVEIFSTQLYENSKIFGPLYCDFATFKSITQFEIRDCIRNGRFKYILFLEFSGNGELLANAMNQLLQIISISLRINDVYARISVSQVAILLNLKKEQEAYLVIDRIIARFYKKISRKEMRITYKAKNIMADHLFQNELEGEE